MGIPNKPIQERLKELRTRLFNVSRKNHLLFPNEQLGIYTLKDLCIIPQFASAKTLVDAIINEPNISLPPKLTPKANYVLNKLISSAKRDEQEYGNNKLKISIIYLQWAHEENGQIFKENSPLYFQSVKLKKSEDQFIFDVNLQLEINPVLNSILSQNTQINFPKSIDLSKQAYHSIIGHLQEQMSSKNISTKASSTFSLKGGFQIIELAPKIGNFTYQTAQVVADYNQLISSINFPPLLNLFLTDKKDLLRQAIGSQNTDLNNYHIAATDSSQELAINHVSKQHNVLIEGPPGTGKSQTISNLISKALSEDKKVLLLSTKKTALETVYNKFKNKELHHLCAIIHDTKKDKKTFITELKKSYEYQSQLSFQIDKLESDRKSKIQVANQAQKFLDRFINQMTSSLSTDENLNIQNLVTYFTDHDLKYANIPQHDLPSIHTFTSSFQNLEDINKTLETNQSHAKLLDLSLQFINPYHLQHIASEQDFEHSIKDEFLRWEQLESYQKTLEIPAPFCTIKTLQNIKEIIIPYQYFWEHTINNVLTEKSSQFIELEQDAKSIFSITESQNKLKKINQHWKNKLSLEQVKYYIEIAQQYEHRFFPFRFKKYRELINIFKQDFEHHFFEIKHSKLAYLKFLEQEFHNGELLHEKHANCSLKYGPKPVLEIYKLVSNWNQNISAENRTLFRKILSDSEKQKTLQALFELLSHFEREYDVLVKQNELSISENFANIGKVNSTLNSSVQCFDNLKQLSHNKDAYNYYTSSSYLFKEIKHNVLTNSYEKFKNNNASFTQFNYEVLSKLILDYNKSKTDLLKLNSKLIVAKQNQIFRKQIRSSKISKQGLSSSQQEEQQNIKSGIKILENEFAKQRALKSIRMLQESEAQNIISVLKPVWMMSPQSVSDTLPLVAEMFDLVIFDEASQVGFAESIPALYRAKKCVVVGDNMQLPPMKFFHRSLSIEEEFSADNNSLIEQAKNKLPSTTLQWHYRSQHEELIAFNNVHFYNKQLKTIPSVSNEITKHSPVEITLITDAAFNYESVREKPLSFHYIKNSVYSNGSNEKEAAYIAELVKHFLLSQQDLNLGILCPSSTQQETIEKALSKITFFDKSYEDLMNDKFESASNFDGLFIRNLENIQGEERDLIIVSLTYGPNEFKQVQNNFGPINGQDGMRRLNVLFSRAKKHLLLVSSIKSSDINTSDNTGTQCLKDYLDFAEQLSLGNRSDIRHLISSKTKINTQIPFWINELGTKLKSKGYHIVYNYGYSSLFFEIAIKNNKDDETFLCGILTDSSPSFYSEKPLEKFTFSSKILEEFGWNVHFILSKDYAENKEKVLANLIIKLIALSKQNKSHISEEKEEEVVYEIKEDKLLFTRLEKKLQFWELAGNLHDVIIRYGKVGSKAKTLIKTYESVAKVIHAKRKLIRQKEKEGYRRV